MSAMREATGAAALAEARLWLGTPYRHQASLRGVGCDCLGLLRGVWRALYGPEPEAPPPYAATWAESAALGTDPLAEAAARHLIPVIAPVHGPLAAYAPAPGDVLLFGVRRHLPARHCAIATGDGGMIHAHEGAAVTEVALTPWWRRHLAGAYRFPDAPSAARPDPADQRSAARAASAADRKAAAGTASEGVAPVSEEATSTPTTSGSAPEKSISAEPDSPGTTRQRCPSSAGPAGSSCAAQPVSTVTI